MDDDDSEKSDEEEDKEKSENENEEPWKKKNLLHTHLYIRITRTPQFTRTSCIALSFSAWGFYLAFIR